MGRTKTDSSQKSQRKYRPAMSLEARENQLIALAVDLAEEQLRKKTASSQVITHFLKLGTSKAELEKAKIEYENQLLQAKTEAYQSAKNVEELYINALNAMKTYSGKVVDDD